MSVHHKSVNDGKECIITIHDKFIFRVYRDFRQAYSACPAGTELITIDLKHTHYLDSSALGMLLLLKKHATENQLAVRIINCSAAIYKAFEIVHLNHEFDITLQEDKLAQLQSKSEPG